MVLNKRDLERAFSPRRKLKKMTRNGTNDNASKSKSTSGPSSNIKVFVRIRPLSDRENSQNHRSVIKVIDDKMLIFDPKEETEGFFFHGIKQKSRDIAKRQNKDMKFIFDRVFPIESVNQEVYQGTTQGIISTLLEGYNCSVFVYGATGAGKTHTMLGNKENPGITFLTMTELYRQIEELKETKDIEIGITYLEVYNENVHDLINPSGPMHLRDDSNGGVLVAGMKVEKILCADQLFQLLQKGNSNRTQHPTDANAESSRSHAVFQVYVKSQTKTTGELKISKLSMIDLAGSERGSATGCAGARFKEGSNINKSLLALGNCINNLADGLRHIPYRDSKLTRLLKDSLGGNCFTVMIANVSPSTSCYEDTYNTLKYATRAKAIKSQLTKNVSVNLRIEHYINTCNEQKKEIAALKEKLRIFEQAKRQPALTPPRANPIYVEKLNNLYREKKLIFTEWLNIEAQVKLLQWRIRCKTQIANQIKNYGPDYNQDLIRIENSLSQLEARAQSLFGKMSELWQRKTKHMEEFNKFAEEMKEAKVVKLLQSDATIKELQCEVAGLKIQVDHCMKMVNLQAKRLEDQQEALDSVSSTCTAYHMLLRARNLITNSMNSEYQLGLSKMKGLKAVTWLDSLEDGDDDEEGVTLSSVNGRPYVTLSLSMLHSSTLPMMIPEPRTKTSQPETTNLAIEAAKPEGEDLNGTFVLNPTDLDEPINDDNKSRKTSFIVPKLNATSTSGTVPTRKFTPGPVKFGSANKENGIKTKMNSKFLIPTPSRPKSALASRHVNIQETKTPDTKVPLNGYKMTRDKERTERHNLHPYIRHKLNRRASLKLHHQKNPRV